MTTRTLGLLAIVALAGAVLSLREGRAASDSQAAGSAATFTRIATVLTGPRCMNCHTATNFPRQGDDRHPHLQNVARGADGEGAPGMRCATCHQASNQLASGVPGAPHWHLAPRSMEWETLTVPQICSSLLNPARNGHRSVAQIVEHLTGDPLVAWAWNPGRDHNGRERKPAPIPRAEFRTLVVHWAATGAHCPEALAHR